MTEETLKEFMDMFPNCPDPDHFPQVVKYLYKIFLYEKSITPPKAELV